MAVAAAPPARRPRVGLVSLGCPKALVDSERIVTRLAADGYGLARDYAGADVVVVNTCGFLDSAKEESLEAIGEAMAEAGRVVVTGCLGVEAERIRQRFPGLVAITGPHQYEAVVEAVRKAAPIAGHPFVDLVPPQGLKLTPRHTAYLKISEGCNHRCSFCIIPSLRGRLASRRPDAIVREAERLVAAGCRELVVISQDTSAYGRDLGHRAFAVGGREPRRAHITDLARALGQLGSPERPVWVRLHYVYPYAHVDELVELMAEGLVVPYLDIPFQHAHPRVLRAMRRPADEAKVLERLAAWRRLVPELAIRSTFIAGFPGETEEEFEHLLAWLAEARLDRVGCFAYEPVDGADANALPGALPLEVRVERRDRLMALAASISADKLQAKIGRTLEVLVDEVDGEGGADARSTADAPEVDGRVLLRAAHGLAPGDMASVRVEDADAVDLFAVPVSQAC